MSGRSVRLTVASMGVVVALAATGCDGTSSSAPSASPTLSDCDLTGAAVHEEVDLDSDGAAEDVMLTRVTDGLRLEVCAAGDVVGTVTLADAEAELWGYVDLDGDGRREILTETATTHGTRLGAVTFTLRGLAVTDLAAQRQIDDPVGGQPFEASGYECRDIDDDGDLELLVVGYQPAETIEHLDVARVDLDATATTTVGIDSYETDVATARARWDRTGCSADTPGDAGVVRGANGWLRVRDDGAFAGDGDLVLTGVAHGGPGGGYVAVGYEQANLVSADRFDTRPAVWRSDDALRWQPVDLAADPGELRSIAALPAGAGFVAVGRTEGRGAAWWSADGTVWELIEIPPSQPGGRVMLWDVHADTDGLIAVGYEGYPPDRAGAGEDRDPAVWRSTDGHDWAHVDDPAFGAPGYQPNTNGQFNGDLVGVTHAPGVGYVAVGSASVGDNSTIDYPVQHPAVWTSPDGQAWRRHDLPGEFQLRGITATPGGTAVLTYGTTSLEGDPASDAILLASHDGIDWMPVEGPFGGLAPTDGIQTVNHALVVPDVGIVAVGSDEQEFETRGAAAVWWSRPAGSPWIREDHDDDVFEALGDAPNATMTGAAWDGHRLVVVGFTGTEVELPNGVAGCCVIAPAIWLWPAATSG